MNNYKLDINININEFNQILDFLLMEIDFNNYHVLLFIIKFWQVITYFLMTKYLVGFKIFKRHRLVLTEKKVKDLCSLLVLHY